MCIRDSGLTIARLTGPALIYPPAGQGAAGDDAPRIVVGWNARAEMCIRDSRKPSRTNVRDGLIDHLLHDFAAGGGVGMGPVSYTHLDVYKRQLVTPSASARCTADLAQGETVSASGTFIFALPEAQRRL